MIVKANESNLNEIYEYIGKDFCRCVYLYLDLKKFGCSNENVNTWIQYDKNCNILCVILKYYTGMHIYSKSKNIIKEEIERLIDTTNPTMICGETQVLNKLNISLKYNYEEGAVRYLDKIKKYEIDGVESAKKGDFYQIGELLYEDEDIGCSYKLEELINQLYDRNEKKFTRNYVIKDGERVFSHAATGAENEDLAMLAYVITDKKYRGKGYAQKVCQVLCQELIEEGKKVCLINYSNESTRLYDKLGFEKYCDWSKWYIDLKKEM